MSSPLLDGQSPTQLILGAYRSRRVLLESLQPVLDEAQSRYDALYAVEQEQRTALAETSSALRALSHMIQELRRVQDNLTPINQDATKEGNNGTRPDDNTGTR